MYLILYTVICYVFYKQFQSMAKNKQEIKKEINLENKRTSDDLNQVTVGFSKKVCLNESLKLIEILLFPNIVR